MISLTDNVGSLRRVRLGWLLHRERTSPAGSQRGA